VTVIYADATVLIALGNANRLALLTVFDGRVVAAGAVWSEVTTEPAASGLRIAFDEGTVERSKPPDASDEGRKSRATAKELLDEGKTNGDVAIIGHVIRQRRNDDVVAVLSDDRRVRRVAEGLGATVTGTIGVVVRAVSDGELTGKEGKRLIERLDERGLHMTGELRRRAIELVEDAAAECD
jgi:predicted nucleic acid-binding protein